VVKTSLAFEVGRRRADPLDRGTHPRGATSQDASNDERDRRRNGCHAEAANPASPGTPTRSVGLKNPFRVFHYEMIECPCGREASTQARERGFEIATGLIC
jgi:hypothetical protein